MPPRKLRCWLCLNGLGRSTGVVAHMLRVQQVAALVAKALLDLLGDSGAPSPAPCTRWPLRNPARLAQARSCLWCSTIFSIIGAQGRSALKSVRARCKRRHQPLALTFAFCAQGSHALAATAVLRLFYTEVTKVVFQLSFLPLLHARQPRRTSGSLSCTWPCSQTCMASWPDAAFLRSSGLRHRLLVSNPRLHPLLPPAARPCGF